MWEENNPIERRKFKRVAFTEPVDFQTTDSKASGGCLAKDISEGGMKLHYIEFTPLESEVIVQMKLAPENKTECLGKIVWVRQIPFSERYQAGLEFIESPSLYDSRKEIQQFIQSQI